MGKPLDEAMKKLGEQLRKNQEERIRDIFGLPKEEVGCMPPGSIVYEESGKITKRKGMMLFGTPVTYEEETDVYTEVGRFFKRKS